MTLDQAQRNYRDGRLSWEDFATYKHLWQTSAPRFSQVCRCSECLENPVCTCPETYRDPPPCPACLKVLAKKGNN